MILYVINKGLRLSLRTVCHVPLYSKNLLKTVHKTHENTNKRKQTMLFTTVQTAFTNLCQIMAHTCDSCFQTNWWHAPQFARPRWRIIRKTPNVLPTLKNRAWLQLAFDALLLKTLPNG